MDTLLQEMSRAAELYKRITVAADNASPHLERLDLFAYRIKAMESDVMKSVLLALLDPERSSVPQAVVEATLDILESWLTRRMLVRASAKNYNQVAAELVGVVRQSDPGQIDHSVRSYLMSQTAEARYLPDDDELSTELRRMPIYKKISRARLRMVLEAIEDHLRGYHPGGRGFAGARVPRATFWIEHIMPRSWEQAWDPPAEGLALDRLWRIHSLGNLTLLTSKLNNTVSNGVWGGETGKQKALRTHDVLLLNRELDAFSENGWTDEAIDRRTEDMIRKIIDIWKVPPGYKSSAVRDKGHSMHSVAIADLLSAGLLNPGQTITPKSRTHKDKVGQVLSDGRIDVDAQVFDSPSGAGYYVRKKPTNGWSFWLVDSKTKKSLASVRREYVERLSLESSVEDEEEDLG